MESPSSKPSAWVKCIDALVAPWRWIHRRRQARAEAILKRIQALLPEEIEVDWAQAPPQAIAWVYDERGRCGRWLSGRHWVEEYGIVWENWPAPSFGATRKAKVDKTPQACAESVASQLEQATRAAPGGSPPRPRL